MQVLSRRMQAGDMAARDALIQLLHRACDAARLVPPPCAKCNGKGKYRCLFEIDDCDECGGKGVITGLLPEGDSSAAPDVSEVLRCAPEIIDSPSKTGPLAGRTPLYRCAKNGDVSTVETLISAGADINGATEEKRMSCVDGIARTLDEMREYMRETMAPHGSDFSYDDHWKSRPGQDARPVSQWGGIGIVINPKFQRGGLITDSFATAEREGV